MTLAREREAGFTYPFNQHLPPVCFGLDKRKIRQPEPIAGADKAIKKERGTSIWGLVGGRRHLPGAVAHQRTTKSAGSLGPVSEHLPSDVSSKPVPPPPLGNLSVSMDHRERAEK